MTPVTTEDFAKKIKEVLGPDTPDQCNGDTREKPSICFLLGTHYRKSILAYVYQKSNGFHVSIEKDCKNFDWNKAKRTKPNPLFKLHLAKMENPTSDAIRQLIRWYAYLHGERIAPDNMQTKARLAKLLQAIGGTINASETCETPTESVASPKMPMAIGSVRSKCPEMLVSPPVRIANSHRCCTSFQRATRYAGGSGG